jgi:hypothetical protein
MIPLSTLIDAIDAAGLPAAVYRTAVRLARMADETGRVVLPWAEYQALTSCTHADAARRHLRAMGDAKLITWRGGATVLLEWQVGRQGVSDIRLPVSENRHRMRVDPHKHEPQPEYKRSVLPEKRLLLSARVQRHHRRQTVRVEKKTCAVWKQARRGVNQASYACHLYVRARPADCLIADPIHSENGSNQSNNQPPVPVPNRLSAVPDQAEALLLAVGVAPETAKQLAPIGFDLVRRAVAAWYTQRKEAGGKYDNHPGMVIYWLRNPMKAGIPPTLPAAWRYSELGRRFRTADESFEHSRGMESKEGSYSVKPIQQPKASRLPRPVAPTDDPWVIALAELMPTLSGVAQSFLTDSRLEAAGDVAGVALYRVIVEERAAAGVTWLTAQAGPAIRRKLASVLGKQVLIEIAVASLETESTP